VLILFAREACRLDADSIQAAVILAPVRKKAAGNQLDGPIWADFPAGDMVVA
jgi:hypothetical protein